MLSLLALMMGGCTSEPSPPSGEVSPAPSPPLTDLKVRDASEALDVALIYLREQEPDNAPSVDITWQEEDVTPKDEYGHPVPGGVHKEFTSNEWTVRVSYAVLPPERTVYHVVVSSIKLGWHWQGDVKADGSLVEVSAFRQMSEEESQNMAEEFLRNSATFIFDGIEDTLRLTDTLRARCPYCWVFIFEFDSEHPGYADRTGKILAEVITHHQAVISVEQLEIISAIMDDKWDMLRHEIVGIEETLDVAELLDNPVYDTLVRTHGVVGRLGEFFCPCFELTSGGKTIMVWYDLMVENDSTERPPANRHEFGNGDRVIVIGELKGEGGTHYSKGDFWATDITYVFPAPPPETQSAPTTITVTFPRVSDYCTIDVDYPSEREGNLPVPEGFITVRKGGAITLPVTIKSIADKPIKIRLTLGGVYPPEFVEYEYPKGYMTLNPGETIDTQIIVKASENAQTGDYTTKEESIHITGYLQEPELGKMFSVFYLSIVD